MTDLLLDQAGDSIRNGSQSFALASKLLGRDVREDAVLLYAWCRHCDDAIDGQTLGHDRDPVGDAVERLAELRARTGDALGGGAASGPFAALARVAERRDIPPAHPHALLDGFAMDVAGRRYERINDTLEYCYHAAGVVGVMMSMIMGPREAHVLDRASDLGIAFQLTNIARDVVEDARAGRCYLPADMRAARGLSPGDDLTEPDHWPAAQKVACDLLHVAERYYASGKAGLRYLPRHSVWGIAAARRIYRDIGRTVRTSCPADWAARVCTSRGRKLMLLARAAADPVIAKPGPRAGLWARPEPVEARSRADQPPICRSA